jgi:hypothetical protein
MHIHSGMIKTWTTVDWCWSESADSKLDFHHATTRIHSHGPSGSHRSGETIWILHHSATPIGLAWDWHEVLDGIVMLADPNSVVSNLRSMDKDQSVLSTLAAAIAHNRLIHAIPWQGQVQQLLAQARFAGPKRPAVQRQAPYTT